VSGYARPYTSFELRTIRDCAETHTDAEIARALGRTPTGVSAQRRKMGCLRGGHGRIATLEVAFIELLTRVQELERKRPRYPSFPQAVSRRTEGERAV
jgi:hypothetical protein